MLNIIALLVYKVIMAEPYAIETKFGNAEALNMLSDQASFLRSGDTFAEAIRTLSRNAARALPVMP